jgi:organic hydroperoxide reductase OsmC/OhrA
MSQPTGEHSYRVAAWWTSGRTGLAKSDSAPNAIHFTAPKEFGGLQGRWTPEELLLAALAGCFTTTLRAVAGSRQFDFTDLQVEARGKVHKTVRLWFRRNCDLSDPQDRLLRGAGTCPRTSEESRKAMSRLPN